MDKYFSVSINGGKAETVRADNHQKAALYGFCDRYSYPYSHYDAEQDGKSRTCWTIRDRDDNFVALAAVHLPRVDA